VQNTTIKKVYTGFWWGNLMERNHLEDPGVEPKILLTWIFRRWDEAGAWIGSIWLWIGVDGGNLSMR
jgi:hypothetical protein